VKPRQRLHPSRQTGQAHCPSLLDVGNRRHRSASNAYFTRHFSLSQLSTFADTADARVCLATELAIIGASREMILMWDDMVRRGDATVYLRDISDSDEIVVGVTNGSTIVWSAVCADGFRVLASGKAVN
jgi:hypothetical protein